MRKTTSTTSPLSSCRRHSARLQGKSITRTFQHQCRGQLRWVEDVLTSLTHQFPAEAAHYPAPGGQWTWQLTCGVMCGIFNWREVNEGDMQQTGTRWGIITTPCMDAPDYNYLADALLNLHLGRAQQSGVRSAKASGAFATNNTLTLYRAYIYHLIDIDFFYMSFFARSALPSSPLRHLSNKSAPARLFNKHFAPSDECATLLKCLFSFCLGGQLPVVYSTVNKGPVSLQLYASSPQWSLAASPRFSSGGKSRFFRPADSLSELFDSGFVLVN